MSSNQIAWLEAAKEPIKIKDTKIYDAGENEIVVKNHAVAINPVDWKIQEGYLQSQVPFPFSVGEDLAGEVVEAGTGVSGFKKGDRVLAHAITLGTKDPANSAFQNYTLVKAQAAVKIPSSLSFTQASVLPLAISTASTGLYDAKHLGLPFPSVTPSDSGKTILIWGAASSVGAITIQLAKASGLTVITTASSKTSSFAKSLGADQVFDYNSPSVVSDIVQAIKSSDKEFAGTYDAISVSQSFKPIGEILTQLDGVNKNVATTLPPEGFPQDVDAKYVFAINIFLGDGKATGKAVWGDYVGQALEKGLLRAVPAAQVVGKGLESLQKALDAQKAGVSAKKIVVEL